MIEVTSDNFEEVVLAASKPVMIDFWAPWCAPCRSLMPHLEKFASESTEFLEVVKVNVDIASELASTMKISSLPTIVMFYGGQETNRSNAKNIQQLKGIADETVTRYMVDAAK